MSALLELRGLGLKFGGLQAVNNVSLALPTGVVAGVIGPNGAGKSTLFNLITGLYRPTAGSIILAGQDLAGLRVDLITRLGIARTFQNIRLFSFMTVRENIFVGYHTQLRAHLWDSLLHTPRHRRDEAAAAKRAAELLEFTDLKDVAGREAHSLSYGRQRRLEIARALAASPRLLLLDEPAAGMNPVEKQALCDVILRIQERGVTVLLIEHDMELVARVCSHVWVLDQGECIADGTPAAVRNDARVISAYLGTAAV